MIKIITTVGTSIITNFMNEEVMTSLTEAKIENASIKTEYKNLLKGNNKNSAERIKKKIENYFLFNMQKEVIQIKGEFDDDETIVKWNYTEEKKLNIHCSAEVYSIFKIIEENPNEKFEIALITTDTALSKIAAEINKIALNSSTTIQGICIHNIQDLDINETRRLNELGFNSLIRCIDNLIDDKSNNYILNITGGFKGIIPFITIYGLIKKIELNYIYDDSDELIKIKGLPITFDWMLTEEVGAFVDKDYIAKAKTKNPPPHKITRMKKLGFLNSHNNLNAFGEMFESEMQQKLPEGKTSLGMLIEYKLFEFFINNDTGYNVTRNEYIDSKSSNYKSLSGNDLDIVLVNNTNEKSYIIIEVKSEAQIRLGSKSLTQFKNRLSLLKKCKTDNLPVEIHYIVWALSSNIIGKTLISKLTEMKNEIANSNLKIPLKAFHLNIPLNSTEPNPYVKMMQDKIDKNNLKQITLN